MLCIFIIVMSLSFQMNLVTGKATFSLDLDNSYSLLTSSSLNDVNNYSKYPLLPFLFSFKLHGPGTSNCL